MLRRKLLIILGILVGSWLVAAVVAILFLNSVLLRLDRVSSSSHMASEQSLALATAVSSAETLLIRAERGSELPKVPSAVTAELEVVLAAMGESDLIPSTDPLSERIGAGLRQLLEWVQAIGNPTVNPGGPHNLQPNGRLVILSPLHADMEAYWQRLHDTIQAQHAALVTRFRAVALGLGATFLLLINGSILMLIRAATSIVQPVEQLVEASRRLAREEFDSRVEIDRVDEFGELARAYNSLAAALAQNEERKIEVMHQVAATLNHELNNAISIIDMQLRLIARKTVPDSVRDDPLRQIHATLAGMTRTVAMLKGIRRIVLADYSGGMKMLDLERSVELDEPHASSVVMAPAGHVPAPHDTRV
jgi:nitrate/nitrite-specific signal transduction histidine kinase